MNDLELIDFCEGLKVGVLDGRASNFMCAAVCWPLSGALEMLRVKHEIVESDLGECNHIWIKLEDGRALDPTAEQFNDYFGLDIIGQAMPSIYLGGPLSIHPDPI